MNIISIVFNPMLKEDISRCKVFMFIDKSSLKVGDIIKHNNYSSYMQVTDKKSYQKYLLSDSVVLKTITDSDYHIINKEKEPVHRYTKNLLTLIKLK